MKITVIASTGRIGQHLVSQAVAAGHDVTAVARSPKVDSGAARSVTVDFARTDPALLESAVSSAHAVLSGLGPRTKADLGVVTEGTRAILNAMAATGTKRLVVVSAAPVGTVASPDRPSPPKHDPGDSFLMRYLGAPIARTLFGKNYVDLATMEDLIARSDVDSTIVRPPRLTNGTITGTYRTAFGQNVPRGASISRADVAQYMLRAISEPETVGRAVGIAY